jgi:uncharacterized membrane protein
VGLVVVVVPGWAGFVVDVVAGATVDVVVVLGEESVTDDP